jgi:putative transposase
MTNSTRGFSPDTLYVPEEDPMRRKRFTEEQIISILKESAAGMKTEEVCRRHGICTNTFYRWKAKYADMEISDVRKLKALDIQALKVVVSKKF